MRRTGRVLAVVAMALLLTFSAGTLVTAPGCSGSSGIGSAAGNEEADKVVRDKMKEYLAKKATAKGQKKK